MIQIRQGCWTRFLTRADPLPIGSRFMQAWKDAVVPVIRVSFDRRTGTRYNQGTETMAMKNPPHPGLSIRKNCLEPLGLTVTEAAMVLGVARHTLSRVLNGHAGVFAGDGHSAGEGGMVERGVLAAAAGFVRPGAGSPGRRPDRGSAIRGGTGFTAVCGHRSRRGMKYRGDSPTSTFVLAVLLTGYTAPAGTWVGQSAAAEFSFERFEVVTGPAERQTVLTGFLLGGPVAELAVLTVDDSGDRLLRIYAFRDGAWAPGLEATLPPEVEFVDVAEIGGRDRLVTFAPGRLNWFDPGSGTERPLVVVSSSFDPPRKTEIPHVDVTHDLNGDGRDDFAVPDVDGFQVFIQTEGGAFADPVKVGRSTDMSRILGADGYRYDPWSQSRVHEVDYDGDGRGDLVFWNGDRFAVHLQDERGLFDPAVRTFAPGVEFDSDDLSSLAYGDMTGRVVHSLTDLNGDGVADLVVFSLEGRNMSARRSAFEVHFGARTPGGGTVFAPEAGARIESDGGIQLGMDRHDFDGDGRVGLMFTTIETRFLESSLWKRIKGFMGGRRRPESRVLPNGRRPLARRTRGRPQNRPGRRAQPSRAGVGAPGHPASGGNAREPADARSMAARVQPDLADRGRDRRRPPGPADRAGVQGAPRPRRSAGAGPVRPTTLEGGSLAARRGVRLVCRPRQGRQAGHPRASPVHPARCSRGCETAAGNRAAPGDGAVRSMNSGLAMGMVS